MRLRNWRKRNWIFAFLIISVAIVVLQRNIRSWQKSAIANALEIDVQNVRFTPDGDVTADVAWRLNRNKLDVWNRFLCPTELHGYALCYTGSANDDLKRVQWWATLYGIEGNGKVMPSHFSSDSWVQEEYFTWISDRNALEQKLPAQFHVWINYYSTPNGNYEKYRGWTHELREAKNHWLPESVRKGISNYFQPSEDSVLLSSGPFPLDSVDVGVEQGPPQKPRLNK